MAEQQTDSTEGQAEETTVSADEQAQGYLTPPDPDPAPEPVRSTWFRIFAGMIERGACSQGVLDGAHAGWRRLDDAEHAELVQMLRDSLAPDPDPANTGATS